MLLHAPGLAPFRSSSLCPYRLICEGSTALQRFTCKITLCNSELKYRPFPCVWEHLSIREKVELLRACAPYGKRSSPFELWGLWGLWGHLLGCFIKYRLCTSIMSFTSSPSRYFLIRSAGIQSSLSTFCRALVHS